MTKLIELRRLPHLTIVQIETFLVGARQSFFQHIHGIRPAFRPIVLPFGSVAPAIGTWLANSADGEELDRDALQQIPARLIVADMVRT